MYVSKGLKKLTKLLGVDVYLVGGCVRNQLMGLTVSDIDICSKLKIEQVLDMLQGSDFLVKLKSAKMGTLEIRFEDEVYEYTTLRRDFYEVGGSHEPIRVEFVEDVRQDSKRRDFSINSIYYNIKNDVFCDFWGGMQDLKIRKIKAVESSENVFMYDGIRLLRAVRFASEFGFEIGEEEKNAITKYANNLKAINGKRKRAEFDKILLATSSYGSEMAGGGALYGIDLLVRLKLLEVLFPFKKVDFSNFKVCELPVEKSNEIQDKELIFFVGLFDFVSSMKRVTFTGFVEILRGALELNHKDVQVIKEFLTAYYYSDKSNSVRKFIFKNQKILDKLLFVLDIYGKNELAQVYKTEFENMKEEKVPFSVRELKIDGEEVRTLLGNDFNKTSKILEKLLKLCLFNPELNEKDKLKSTALDLIKREIV